MPTPSRIATSSAGALVIADLLVSFLWKYASPVRAGELLISKFAEALLAAIAIAVLVWVGVYAGARRSGPDQHTDRIVTVLAVVFALFGGLLSIPIPTHNVVIDIRQAVGEWSTIWPFLAALIGLLAAPALVAFVLTRAVIAAVDRKVKREA